MKLKELLKVLDDDLSVTIHQDGELDGHYVQLSDIPYDLINLEVLRIDGCTSTTDLFIHIDLPDRKGDVHF